LKIQQLKNCQIGLHFSHLTSNRLHVVKFGWTKTKIRTTCTLKFVLKKVITDDIFQKLSEKCLERIHNVIVSSQIKHGIVSVYTKTHYSTQASMTTPGQNIILAVNGGSRRGNTAIAMAHFQSYMGG